MKNPDKYDISNMDKIDLDSITEPDFVWDDTPMVTTHPYMQNYFDVGSKVVDPFGNVGVVVGVEYLGRVRKPIYWVRYENNPAPQPELGDVLMPYKVSGEFQFKRILSSVSVPDRYATLRNLGLPHEDVIISPESYSWINDLGWGGVYLAVFHDEETVIRNYDNLEVKDVIPLALSLKIPVKIAWLGGEFSPVVAYNVVKENGLL